MSERMTGAEFKEVLAILNGGTQGEIQIGTQTIADARRSWVESLNRREAEGRTTSYVLTIAGSEDEAGTVQAVATTGAGPDAEANIKKIAVALLVTPCAIGALARFIESAEAAEEALSAAESILWMANRYAESGGTSGPEMRDYDAAVERIKAGREALRKVLDGEEGE